MRAPSMISPTSSPSAASIPALAAAAGDGDARSSRSSRIRPGNDASADSATGTGEPLSTTTTS